MKTTAIIAIICAVALGSAGAFAVISNMNDKGEEKITEVTINDSLGNDVTVEGPVKKICTVNTHAAEFLRILDADDRVVSADSDTIGSLSSIYRDVIDVGSYKNPTGEEIVRSGAKYVISQSSSRSLSTATEESLKTNYGITVLRLDCYGETMMKDVEQIVKILVSSDSEDRFGTYREYSAGVRDRILAAASQVSGNPSYLFYFASLSAFSNENSELGKITSSIHGTNLTRTLMDGNIGTKTTNTPAPEKIWNYDNEAGHSIDYVFIRSTEGKTLDQAYQSFLGYKGTVYDFSKLTAAVNNHVFVIETDILAGADDYIGMLCIANAYGITIDRTPQQLVDEYNSMFGLTETFDCLMKAYPAA